MVINAIRELNKKVPFRPYLLRLASGITYSVPRPDFIAIAPKGSWVMVSDENDHPHWISSILIEEVTPATNQPQSG
jgi:hypothetical protein